MCHRSPKCMCGRSGNSLCQPAGSFFRSYFLFFRGYARSLTLFWFHPFLARQFSIPFNSSSYCCVCVKPNLHSLYVICARFCYNMWYSEKLKCTRGCEYGCMRVCICRHIRYFSSRRVMCRFFVCCLECCCTWNSNIIRLCMMETTRCWRPENSIF